VILPNYGRRTTGPVGRPRGRVRWWVFLRREQDRIRAAYGADRCDRLKSLKRKYDPDNFFRINPNIPPS
jgi:hypothetical protein